MNKKGFTLIEVLITMVLVTVISLTITTVYVIGMKTYQEELATSTVQSNGQTIMDALVNDIWEQQLCQALAAWKRTELTVGTVRAWRSAEKETRSVDPWRRHAGRAITALVARRTQTLLAFAETAWSGQSTAL